MKLDFSPEGWGRVILYTVCSTAICVSLAIYVDSFNFAGMSPDRVTRALLVDTLLPIILAVPLLLFFTGKLRELAIAHKKLTVYASTDALTQVMNRAAFSTLVEAYLSEVREHEERKRGALLIIDADNFKSINDAYGHDRGDEALITIAETIKQAIRGPDLIGRMGGEEFGVFLPGASPEHAERVAERIRRTVNEARFSPDGDQHRLSVSVGGAVFERELPYSELFRLADQQLYSAKRGGRNRIAVAPIVKYGPVPAAA